MSNVIYLHSKQDVLKFVEQSRRKEQEEAIISVLMWLTACSLQVDVWKN
jgi:hypothetical protein